MTAVGIDTSIAIPLLVATHEHHREVRRWWAGRDLALSGHALVETYSVLTRLPGDLRLSPDDAARLLSVRFSSPFLVPAKVARSLPAILARLNVAGGAVYDALVALAARAAGADLATRDGRARRAYEAVGVRVIVVE